MRHSEGNRQARFEANKAKAKELLGGICAICGTTEALDFDHIDPATKLFNISKGWRYSEELFWAEVAKCQLLCRPHHLEKSSKIRSMDVLYIHGLYELGHSQRAIAREFDVGKSQIGRILIGENWKSLEA